MRILSWNYCEKCTDDSFNSLQKTRLLWNPEQKRSGVKKWESFQKFIESTKKSNKKKITFVY